MQNFRSPSTGYFVRFISRYRDTNDYELQRGPECSRLSVNDDGAKRIYLADQPSAEQLMAYLEYKHEERRQYEQWRKDNAKLLAGGAV